ncbi:MAG: hypothetical protein ACE5Q6_21430 [Dehalococcoidia bacterium]
MQIFQAVRISPQIPYCLKINWLLPVGNQFLGRSREVLVSWKHIVAKWLEMGEEKSAEFTIKEFPRIFTTPIPPYLFRETSA